jgi:phosphoenolpyruvate-protein phosphotransferase
MTRRLKGVAAAPGIAIAPLVRFHLDLELVPERTVDPQQIPAEVARLDAAIVSASRSILFLRHELSKALSDREARIYDTHLALLHDATFKADMEREIAEQRVNAEIALQRVIARYEQVFEGMQDPAMRERAADVRDVGRQVMSALLEQERVKFTAGGEDYIFVADEFLPSDAGLLDRAHLRGIVTARGGKYSHGAILARSLGIPALVAIEDLLARAHSGMQAVLDGETGTLVLDPGEADLAQYRQALAEHAEVERRVFEVRFLPPVTPDGTEVRLMANVESVRDLEHVELNVVSGIGLFRTEFAFMERRQFPAEEEQFKMYSAAVARADKRPVTFRTLDIGGDKPLAYFRTPAERNPVLGWRGLRITLDWPDLFYAQVRALLRASAAGPVRILLPMVTSIDEVRRCREVVREIRADMQAHSEAHDPGVQLGVMVEVPAVVEMLDLVLPLVDFVSVGTNDLTQYLLAVDRDNPRVASMYDPYHPALVRVLGRIAAAAARAGRPASICGEIAGDHYYTPLLLGLGFRELSMAPVFLPRVKLMVRSFPLEACEALARRALQMATAGEIRALARDEARVRWSRFLRQTAVPAAEGSLDDEEPES